MVKTARDMGWYGDFDPADPPEGFSYRTEGEARKGLEIATAVHDLRTLQCLIGAKALLSTRELRDLVATCEDTVNDILRIVLGDGAKIHDTISKMALRDDDAHKIPALESLQQTLFMSVALAKGAYRVLEGSGLDEDDLKAFREDYIGRKGCNIGSPSHPKAVLMGFKINAASRTPTDVAHVDGSILFPYNLEVSVAVRGSLLDYKRVGATFADWFSGNFAFWKVPTVPGDGLYPEVRSVHAGFYSRYRRMWPVIRDEIKHVLKLAEARDPRLAFAVTGHSQGGAIASLLAIALSKEYNDRFGNGGNNNGTKAKDNIDGGSQKPRQSSVGLFPTPPRPYSVRLRATAKTSTSSTIAS